VFARDPLDAVVKVLQAASTPLAKATILQHLVDGGVPGTDAAKAWNAVRRRLKDHEQVGVEGVRYVWCPAGRRALSAFDALDRLVAGGLGAPRRKELAELIRVALGSGHERAASERPADIAPARMLAELASEVEELVVNEASARAIVQRVRARVARSNLEPVASAGDEVMFDRQRHKPIGGGVHDGARVVVVRPGYVWRSAAGDVLVAEVLVEE
jgi:hypothetical protein